MEFEIQFINEIILKFDRTALYEAVDKGNLEIIKLLLAKNELNINTLNISNN